MELQREWDQIMDSTTSHHIERERERHRILLGSNRYIPVSKWLITMVSKSPKRGCSPSKWPFHGL